MKKRMMHPAVLFSLLWFIILLMHFIFSLTVLNGLFPIATSTFLIFFIGTLCFTAGAFIETVAWQKNNSASNDKHINTITKTEISVNLRYLLITILIIGLPFYIAAAYRVFLASNIADFFQGLRTELSYGEENMGPLKYLVSFSFVVFAINAYSFFIEKNKTNKILLIINFVVTLTYAVFITGRGLFLMLLIIYLGLSHLHNKNFSTKRTLRLFILFVVAFVAIGFIYGKGGDVEDSAKENIKTATETTGIYLVASINALDWERHHQFQVDYKGNNSLRFFMKIGEQLNLIPNSKVNELIQPFVFVPYPTNVYTIYSSYIKDFGNFYAWFMVSFFGFIHTFIYYKALLTKSLRYSVYYSFLLFPLLMSFFQDQYLSLFSSWLQIVVYFEGILLLNKFFISKK